MLVTGSVIGGGTVNVSSVLISQRNRSVSLDPNLNFTPFTDEELKRIQAEIERAEEAMRCCLKSISFRQ